MDGSCHCGAVRWRFEGEAFTVSGDTSTYVWNRAWLAFHFCARCACVVAWLTTSRGQDGRLYGAVNLRLAAEPNAVAAVPIVRHDTETMSDLPRDGRCVADVWF